MGKNQNSQTRKYAGKSFSKTKQNTLNAPTHSSSTNRFKSEHNFKTVNKSSTNLLLRPGLIKSKSEDSVHKNKLVTGTYNDEQKYTSVDSLAELIKGLEIQEEQNQKTIPNIVRSDLSPKIDIDIDSASLDGSLSPRLQRKGSFDLNLSKSPVLSFSSSDDDEYPTSAIPGDLDLSSNDLGWDIDSAHNLSCSTSPRYVDTLTDTDKDIIVNSLLSMIFFNNCQYTFTGYQPIQSKVKLDLYSILLNVLFLHEEHTSDDMDLEGTEYIECFVTSKVINQLVYELRYETPYGISPRLIFLENIARVDPSIYYLISQSLYVYSLEYLELERHTPVIDPDDVPSPAVTQVTGHIHRYISLFDSYVKFLREFTSMEDIMVPQHVSTIFKQLLYYYLSILVTFLKTRTALYKYTDLLASLANILISINNEILPRLIKSIIKIWPNGYMEKELSLLEFLEQLLSSLPPVYVLMEYKQSILSIFRIICRCISRYQARVASRAVSLLTNYYICNNYIYTDNDICEMVKLAFINGSKYWNPIVAEECERAFDTLLDSL